MAAARCSDPITDALLALEEGDEVTVSAGGREFAGVVIEAWHDPIEYVDGLPINGELDIGIELDNETVERYEDVPTHSLSITALEKGRGWTTPDAAVWAPEVDDEGYIVSDYEYNQLGDIENIETDQA